MLKKTIKLITAILIFMLVNKVYAYNITNQKLVNDKYFNTVIKQINLDKLEKAKIKVNVIDDNNNKITKSGIKFKIKDKATDNYICNNNNCIYETDSTGSFITNKYLEEGEYYLIELEDSNLDGYLYNSKYLMFTVNEDSDYDTIDNEAIIELNFINREAKGGFEFDIIGEMYSIINNRITYTNTALSSSKFLLYAAEDIYSANNTLIYSKDEPIDEISLLNSDGHYKRIDMYFGKYYLIQTKSTMDNLTLTEPFHFEIKYQDKFTEDVMTSFELRNRQARGTLTIKAIDSLTSEPIKNTKINVYTTKNELVYDGVTNEEGILFVNDLTTLDYYFKEIESAPGYLINTDNTSFVIKKDGDNINMTIKCSKVTGTFSLTKIDYNDNTPIKDAVIGIYNEKDELLYLKSTDEEGKIIIDDIPYGKYYYQEISVPEEYSIDDTKYYFEIKGDGEVVEANLISEKTDAPNTYLNENYWWLIISIILFVTGGYLIHHAKD